MVSVSIISGFYPFGKYSILMADMRYQFVDYFGYMKKIFFSNDDYFYSFSKTFGGDMAGLAAYYCNTPFLILLLFVPNDLLPGGILIMMTLMLGFIGLTFNIFLNEVYGLRYTSLIFSTAYAFTGYLMGYFNCTQYYFNIIMLPLVMLGICRIIKYERISILYMIAQALSVFSSYYIGYMICIFSIIFFIYMYFTSYNDIKKPSDIKVHLRPVWIYISSSVVGVFMASVSLLCAVISLNGQSSRKHIPLSLKGNFNISEIFSGMYSTAFNGNVSDGLPLIYSGAIGLAFILLFYLGRSISKKEKLLSAGVFILLILGFYVDFLNVMWHGFSYPIGFPYRNSFLFSFMVLFLSYKAFIMLENTKFFEVIISLSIYVIYSLYICVIKNEDVGIRQITITGAYLMMIYICIHLYKKGNGRIRSFIMPAFLIIVIMDLSYNAYISVNAYFPDKEEDDTITIQAFKDFVDETSTITGYIEKEDPSFYRMEKLYRRSNNDAMLIGYNGLSHFSSCETKQAMHFLESLGFRNNDNWAFYGEGSTSFADCFMGMKYMLSQYDETPKPYEKILEYNDKTVYKNPYALPLCFTMNDDCLNLDAGDFDHFLYQNALARSMNYNGSDIYRAVEDVEIKEVNLKRSGYEYSVIENDLDAYLEFSFINTSTDFMFMFFDADDLQDTNIVINDIEKQPYFTQYGWSIRELGHFPEGERVNVRLYALQDSISMKGFEFYYEDKEALGKWYEAAREDKTELNKITSSHLKGTADVKKTKKLVFSFPYEEAWSVYIDGIKVENKKALDGLLAVDIDSGHHEIELRYIPKGIIIGTPLTIIFFIIFAILCIKSKKNQREV